jgi:hypothetical protein
MKMTSLKSIARHKAAVQSGKVEKTNVIGIKKAIGAIERGEWPAAVIDALFELEQTIAECRPVVVGSLHDTGLKVLRNPRYAKRWNDAQRAIINYPLLQFRLIRFDRLGERGRYSVPVYQAIGDERMGSFAFRNIPWQTARFEKLDDGPRVVPERGE